MKWIRYSSQWFALLALCTLTACPPTMEATRDGGTPCTSNDQCNPSGMTCGAVNLCIEGFCADTQTVIACLDGSYPDSGPSGNCATYEDCNPPPACGSVVACVNFVCDQTGPRLSIPCADAGTDASGSVDAAPDALTDAASDAMDEFSASDVTADD